MIEIGSQISVRSRIGLGIARCLNVQLLNLCGEVIDLRGGRLNPGVDLTLLPIEPGGDRLERGSDVTGGGQRIRLQGGIVGRNGQARKRCTELLQGGKNAAGSGDIEKLVDGRELLSLCLA